MFEFAPPAELAELATQSTGFNAPVLVQNADDAKLVAADRLKATAFIKAVEEKTKPMKEQAHKLHKDIVAFEKQLLAPAVEYVSNCNAGILAYQREEERKAEDARRKAQALVDEAARKQREAAELAANKQREIEKENLRIAEEARKAAETAQGKERAKLLADAAKAETKASTAAERADEKVAQAAAVVAPTVAVEAPATKVDGLTTRKTWKATLFDIDACIAWCIKNNRLDLLEVSDKGLQGMAKALGSRAKADGVTFEEVSTIAGTRGAK